MRYQVNGFIPRELVPKGFPDLVSPHPAYGFYEKWGSFMGMLERRTQHWRQQGICQLEEADE